MGRPWTVSRGSRSGCFARNGNWSLATGIDHSYRNLLAELWPRLRLHLDVEHNRYARALTAGGVHRMLAELTPYARWNPPVLEIIDASMQGSTCLDGRGLLVVPTMFCWHPEYTWSTDGGPSLLFVPAGRDPATVMRLLAPARPTGYALGALLGRTRAAVLELIATTPGITTGTIASRLGCAQASVSEHATVLREAGLVASDRHRNTVRHRITPLGEALLGSPTEARKSIGTSRAPSVPGRAPAS